MSGQTTFERINETATLSFYYLYQEPVVAKKHSARPRIEKKEAAELRMDIIAKGSLTMDAFFIISIVRDICEGLYAIHRSSIGCHGHLTSSVCLVDERWQVKISNFGLDFIKAAEQRPNTTLLWTAPEHLRENNNVGSKQGDVYSFAIICSEIITRKSAFQMIENGQTVEGLVYKIKYLVSEPLRPSICGSDLQDVPPTMV
ncbi:Guanylate cyclase receptor-type gcy-1 [Toxocara canis]|uniref:guanylate cyclase n=1 Tax=Toxocara canis TaxID=6265 RepID=A0A0B2VM34_TOXCA|nr:Guanylate cyclase receptor-type gcy-1 [Toxocara canis]